MHKFSCCRINRLAFVLLILLGLLAWVLFGAAEESHGSGISVTAQYCGGEVSSWRHPDWA